MLFHTELLRNKGVPAISRIFILVDMITNTKSSNCLYVFKMCSLAVKYTNYLRKNYVNHKT